jgi:hypothetical protein
MRTTNLPEGPQSGSLAEVVITLAELPGETIVRRESRLGSDGNQVAVLVVRPVAEPPPRSALDRLAHEYELRDELDGRSFVKPLELVRDGNRAMLVLEDTSGEPLDRLLGEPMEVGCLASSSIT